VGDDLCWGSGGRNSPPAGSRGGARGRGPGGTKSPEAEAILYFYGQILTNLTVLNGLL